MTTEPRKTPLQNIEYLRSKWRHTSDLIRRERRNPTSLSKNVIAKLEGYKRELEGHIRVLNGADPNDESHPPF